MSGRKVELSLATESFNLAEGQSWGSLVSAVQAVAQIVDETHSCEGLVLDVTGDPRVASLLATTHRQLRHIDCRGMNYDEVKDCAADEAAGRYIAYLDGDCRPAQGGWLERLVAPLRDGRATATAGLTLYPGDTPLTHAFNVLDFGFLLDNPGGPVGCYASNNVAFLTRTRREFRTPKTLMRCTCYAHTQRLAQAGHDMLSVPAARVVHERPPARRERYRRGYDLVATCWIHPALPDTALLGERDPSTSIIRNNLLQDFARLDRYIAYLGLQRAGRAEIARAITRLRRLDAYGVRAALRDGARSGANEVALAAHRSANAN